MSKAGVFDLTVEKDELLAEEGILGDQLGFASEEVSRCGDRYRIESGLREMEDSVLESLDEAAEELDD